MVSTTDDAEFAPRSAVRAERAPAGPQLGAGLGLGLDDGAEPLASLLPPGHPTTDRHSALQRPRGRNPGGPGFELSAPRGDASVGQHAEAAWRAAGAEWFPAPDPAPSA